MNNTLAFCTNAGASSPSSVAPVDSCGARGSRGFARCSRSCSRSALRPGAVSLPAEALWGITSGGEGHEKARGEQAARRAARAAASVWQSGGAHVMAKACVFRRCARCTACTLCAVPLTTCSVRAGDRRDGLPLAVRVLRPQRDLRVGRGHGERRPGRRPSRPPDRLAELRERLLFPPCAVRAPYHHEAVLGGV